MGLFDTIGNVFDDIGEFFDGDDSFGIDGGDILDVGSRIFGAVSGRRANDEAAERIAAANAEAAESVRQGNAAATARFDELNALARPGTDFLRSIVASDPFTLTPSQQLELEDVRRDAGAALAASGLRGAGRATTAALRGVEADFRGNSIDSNLRRSDAAASQLAGTDLATTGAAAGIDANTGRATGAAILEGETAGAEAGLANETLRGQAIGDISSVIAGAFKEQGRDPRFREKPRERDDASSQRATL